jgi:two-component system, OmpR family, KDP operon response regulator KdpE
MNPRFNVLVIDDEAALRKVLQTTLTARGFSVEEVASGERAVEIIQWRTVDAILLDINMPGMSGLEACRRLRSLAPTTAIIMVTVRDAEADIVQALEAGADDYITKPFRFGELVARIRAVLRRTAEDNAGVTQLQVGDLEIDFDKRLVRRGGEAVHLTPTEFELLAILMKNEGMLLTHKKLLQTIWGPEYGEELEYLRSYVRTLRKKLEDDPAQPKYILTEPWVGYRFQNPSDLEAVPIPAGEE